MLANGDGDGDPRAHVRECSNVWECNWSRDGMAEIGLKEDAGPPVKVVGKAFWGI